MSVFRVALSADFRQPDGTFTFPDFDLTPLQADPRIELQFVEVEDGRISAAALQDFDALILLSPKFDADSIPPDGRLALVARFGVGYDSVDVEACTRAGIAVAITPDGVRRPVAASILTLILALAGNLFIKDKLVRQGPEGFARRVDHMGTGLVGKTLGSVGMGNIGAEMFRLCAPLDMKFIAHDPWIDPALAADLGVTLVDLETVFRDSDFVTLNTPLTNETHHLANAGRLALMKPTAYLINTSRGPVVDLAALVEVLKNKRIAGAALDVFDPEPPLADDPLLALDNVILTPHALCWTDQCFAGIGASDVAAVFDVRSGVLPKYLANPEVGKNASLAAKLAACKSAFS
jgi:D-3-phosphoglycerate dehydrogenase